MTDDDIRAVVRDAIARYVTPGEKIPPRPAAAGSGATHGIDVEHRHSSHGLFVLSRGGDDDGACLIEPAVRCTHCGYCESYGH
jgi:hypothetical protein